jgi:hypothetical protein
LCKIVGAFIGDGHIDRDNGFYLAIPKTDKCREKYKQLLLKVFGKVSENDDRLFVWSKAAAKLLKDLDLAYKTKDKTIPDWVFELPREYKLAVVEGLIDTDGYRRKDGTCSIELTAKKVIERLKVLLDEMGFKTQNIYHRIRSNKSSTINIIKPTTELWHLEFKLDGKRKNNHYNVIPDEAKAIIPIGCAVEAVKSIKYIGKKMTYDLHIKDHHNYVANGFVVHNSAPGGGRKSKDAKPDEQLYSAVTGWYDGFIDGIPNGWDAMKGTSMATPAVAGLITLLVEAGKVNTTYDVKRVLREKGHTKDEEEGYGLIKLSMFT